MDLTQALDYLNSFGMNEINPGLERIAAILAELDNPQDDYLSVQITGTNGKTSTARIASHILTLQGLKTGLYTSPHLISVTERYLIQGEEVSLDELTHVLTILEPIVTRLNERIRPDSVSYFELATAAAFLIFKRSGVDMAVLEVGMGGRWDATSVVKPKVSVITNVALDHTDRLGDSIIKIATEKAHIIKPGKVAVAGDLTEDALKVVKDRCALTGSELIILGQDFFLVDKGDTFLIEGIFGRYDDLRLKLIGQHQRKNAAVAIAASETAIEAHLSVDKLKEALLTVESAGRLEVVSNDPTILLDGAHNPAGAKELARSLREEFKYERLSFILAIFDDKDIEGILSELTSLDASFIVTKNKNERAADPQKIARLLKGRDVAVAEDVAEALVMSTRAAGPCDLICITGSLATVAEARAQIMKGDLLD